MHKPNESFNGPSPRTPAELLRWMDAYTESTRAEVARIARRPSEMAAACHLDAEHIRIGIKPTNDPENPNTLRLAWSYRIWVRRKVESFLPTPKPYCRKDSFPYYQINGMLGALPDELREIASDSIVMGYMEEYRLLCARETLCIETYDTLQNPKPDVGNDEVLEAIDAMYPGELERLYAQIRTGTLGK